MLRPVANDLDIIKNSERNVGDQRSATVLPIIVRLLFITRFIENYARGLHWQLWKSNVLYLWKYILHINL